MKPTLKPTIEHVTISILLLYALSISACVTIPVTISDNSAPVTVSTEILKSNSVLP